jgi:hypothetical protein
MTAGRASVAVLLPAQTEVGPGCEGCYQSGVGWPTGPAEAMMVALLESIEQQIQSATSDEQRTRLERFREATTGMGRELLLRVLTQAATGQI